MDILLYFQQETGSARSFAPPPPFTDPVSSSIAAHPAGAATLLATGLSLGDAGLLPHHDGAPVGALLAAKRKLQACLSGGDSAGVCSEVAAAGAALEQAVRRANARPTRVCPRALSLARAAHPPPPPPVLVPFPASSLC